MKLKVNININQCLYEDIKQNEEILQNQSSKNYLLSKNEPISCLLFLFSSYSTQTWLKCPHENKIHHNVHSTNRKRFPSYTFPSSHKIKHQNIKISGHQNIRKISSCFLEKALYAGQGALTQQAHIPKGTRGR